MLMPIIDFEKHSAAEQAVDMMPPEIKEAVKQNRAIAGMDRRVRRGDGDLGRRPGNLFEKRGAVRRRSVRRNESGFETDLR